MENFSFGGVSLCIETKQHDRSTRGKPRSDRWSVKKKPTVIYQDRRGILSALSVNAIPMLGQM